MKKVRNGDSGCGGAPDNGIVRIDSSQRASLSNDEANQAGSFFVFPKPFLSIESQIHKLESKGFAINDCSKASASLMDLNYYRLRAYWATLKKKSSDSATISFDDVLDIYDFDQELRLWLWKAIAPIEVKLRSQFAYHLSNQDGPLSYLDQSHFSDRDRHNRIMKSLGQEIERAKRNQEPCVCHNLEKYGVLPCWAAVELMTMGQLSSLFGLLRNEHDATRTSAVARKIAESFGQRLPVIKSWLMHLCTIRNLCAHHNRFYGRTMRVRPKMLRRDACWAGPREFPTFLVIKRIYERSWPELWPQMAADLRAIIAAHPGVDLKPLGFPDCWQEVLA